MVSIVLIRKFKNFRIYKYQVPSSEVIFSLCLDFFFFGIEIAIGIESISWEFLAHRMTYSSDPDPDPDLNLDYSHKKINKVKLEKGQSTSCHSERTK